MRLPRPKRPRPEQGETGEGIEVIRHASSVEASWSTNTPAAWGNLLLVALEFAALAWFADDLATWVMGMLFALPVATAIGFVWNSFRDVAVHADADGLRVHDQHALGFSTSQYFARADLRQISVRRELWQALTASRFKLVALVGPDSKKKVVARGFRSEEAALKAESALARVLFVPDEATARLADVPRFGSDPWESLPGDGR